jgi:cytochrome c oxidase assembly protein subunit 15
LLVAGGLVTSNDAGLAVPDWPTSFGSFRMPRMVGGVAYEHGHRMFAATIGLLTIVLAAWTWLRDRRGWMRALTAIAVLGVVFQGVLGGLSVLSANWASVVWRPLIATAHGVVGQTMFCVLAAVALFTGRAWHEEPALATSGRNSSRLRLSSALLVAALYVQLIFGAAFRHTWTKLGPVGAEALHPSTIVKALLVPHMINALLVIALIVWTTMLVFRNYPGVPQLRRPAMLLHILLLLQLLLGFGAFFARVVWHMDAPQPQAALVGFTVGHLAVGALMLAISVVLALQLHRATLMAERVAPAPSTRVREAAQA